MKLIRFLFLVLGLAVLTGCPFQTREEIRQQEEEKQLKESVNSIQRQKADSELRYADIQNDLRVVAGRVDTLDHNNQVSSQNTRQQIDGLKKLIQDQNEKIHLLEQHIDATEQKLSGAIQALASNPPPPQNSGPSNIKETPNSKKQESNHFEEAEGLFTNKEFKKAIVKYQAYRDKAPHGAKAAEATYKIGVCFSELGLKRDAKDFFQETIESFPGTTQAKKAKKRLAQLK